MVDVAGVTGRRRAARAAAVVGLAALLVLPVVVAPSAAVATGGPAFGISSIFASSPPSGIDFHAGDVARVASEIDNGAIMRIEVPWSEMQPSCTYLMFYQATNDAECQGGSPGPIVWAPLDAALSQISAYLTTGKVRLLPYVDSAPAWAQSFMDQPGNGGTISSDMPPANDTWAQLHWQAFVAALVRHLEAAYPGALAGVEVWNEENGINGWTTNSGPDPARYTVVLCDAYAGVRSVDATLPVILGGLDEGTPTYPNETIKQFLGQAYVDATNGQGADIRRCMTSIGVHPYTGTDPSTGGQFAQILQDAAVAAAAGGDPGRPLAITEFGVSVTKFTAAQQGQWMVDAYEHAGSFTPSNPVTLFIGYSLFDQQQYDQGQFGVCASPSNPRPAASALKQLLTGNQSAQEGC